MEIKQENINKILELFYKYGIKSVSMDDIASELGVSKKTLYRQFEGKNNMVEQIENHVHEYRHAEFQKICNKELPAIEELLEIHQFMKTFINSYSRAFERDMKKFFAGHYQKRYDERKENIITSVKRNLNRGIEDGVYRSDINVEAISAYLFSFVMFMMEFEDQPENQQTYFDEVFKLNMLGLLCPEGFKKYKEKY